MKRKFYVKPNTRLFSVELEETFAGSAEVTNSKENTGRVERQGYSEDLGFETTLTFGAGSDAWKPVE